MARIALLRRSRPSPSRVRRKAIWPHASTRACGRLRVVGDPGISARFVDPAGRAICAGMSNYDSDVYEWTKEQADALRRRAANELDWDNLAEEIESLGASNLDQIESRLENLILHLLKWKYQPEWQCGSWRGSIFEGRRRI